MNPKFIMTIGKKVQKSLLCLQDDRFVYFGDDIGAFLGNRRNHYDEHSLQLPKEVYRNLSE